MRLFTDDYFHIGAAHLGAGLPCQDYALSASLPNSTMAYAVVSDGCSTGGRTDVGSRVISHTADVAIRDHWKRYSDATVEGAPKEIDLHQQVLLTNAKVNLGVRQNDLLATCMYAFVSEKGGFVHVRGDGVVALVYRDGMIGVRKYDWSKNMPFYPAYFEDNHASYLKAQADGCLNEEQWVCDREKFVPVKATRIPAKTGVHGTTMLIGAELARDQIAYIALFTDGVTQVDGIDWKDALLSLISFKTMEGAFAKRRMIRFIKDAQKTGKGPMDDIAYAVIRFGTDEE